MTGRRLVRYVPLIGSPSWMSEQEAERRLRREDDLYMRLSEAGARPSRAPRIERPTPPAKGKQR